MNKNDYLDLELLVLRKLSGKMSLMMTDDVRQRLARNALDVVLIDVRSGHLPDGIDGASVVKPVHRIDEPIVAHCVVLARRRIGEVAPPPTQIDAVIGRQLNLVVRD